MITITFIVEKEVFAFINIWMIGKTSMKKTNKKEDLHSQLYMQDITEADYIHVKRVCKDFATKYLEEYHDLYV